MGRSPVRLDTSHLALAVFSGCDILFTTDDRFLRRAGRIQPPPPTRVLNPLRWVSEMMLDGREDDDDS
jgi:hypothetical protein